MASIARPAQPEATHQVTVQAIAAMVAAGQPHLAHAYIPHQVIIIISTTTERVLHAEPGRINQVPDPKPRAFICAARDGTPKRRGVRAVHVAQASTPPGQPMVVARIAPRGLTLIRRGTLDVLHAPRDGTLERRLVRAVHAPRARRRTQPKPGVKAASRATSRARELRAPPAPRARHLILRTRPA